MYNFLYKSVDVKISSCIIHFIGKANKSEAATAAPSANILLELFNKMKNCQVLIQADIYDVRHLRAFKRVFLNGVRKDFYVIAARYGSEETGFVKRDKEEIQMKVLKAVLCNITKAPVALVLVDKATRTIRVAGAYTAAGDAVHGVDMKVSADKRKIAKFSTNFPNIVDSVYNARTATFSLL